jgi:hypothetical protein
LKESIIGIFAICLMTCSPRISYAQSFSNPITCKFQFGQALQADKAKTDIQSTPLEWNFSGLRGNRPMFLSGGDTGPVTVHFHQIGEGASLFLKQGNGAHLVTIWPDGQAFWSKHNNLFGSKSTQQFRGTCEDVRTVNY